MLNCHIKILENGKERYIRTEEELVKHAEEYVKKRLIELQKIVNNGAPTDVSPPPYIPPPSAPIPPVSPMSKAALLLNKLKKDTKLQKEANASKDKALPVLTSAEKRCLRYKRRKESSSN